MARLFSRKHKGKKVGGAPLLGQLVEFAADGVAPVTLAADANDVLHQLGSIYEVGKLGVYKPAQKAGNATTTITVPSGKYWRLVGAEHTVVADANAANRIVSFQSTTSADVEIEEIVHSAVTATNTGVATTLWETDDFVNGNEGVAAQGTLTIAEPVTDGDQFSINGVQFTLVAALTGAANEIFIGASEAATKLALNAAFQARDSGTTLHSVTDAVYASLECTAAAFSSDDMVFTANVKGTAGNSIATIESGQELTHASNVFDAVTLGTTTAGVGQADALSSVEYPAAGSVLDAGEKLVVSVTNGVAGDTLDFIVFYIEFDVDPNGITPTA